MISSGTYPIILAAKQPDIIHVNIDILQFVGLFSIGAACLNSRNSM